MSNKHAAELFSGTGANAADVLFTTPNIQQHELFTLMSTTGAVEVLASVNGTSFSTVVLAMEDQGATANSTYVIVTVPNRVYKFWGKYTRLRVVQNGATATTASLLCGAGA